jgi:hypothetical protein
MGRKSQIEKKMLINSNLLSRNPNSIMSNNNSNVCLIDSLSTLKIYTESEERIFLNYKIFIKEIINSEIQLNDNNACDLLKLFDIDKEKYEAFKYKYLSSSCLINVSNIVPKTYFTENYFNTENESLLFLLPVLRDKCHQIYTEFLKQFKDDIERAHYLVSNNITVYDGHNATKEEFMSCFFQYLAKQTKLCMNYASKIPGCNKLCADDYNKIIKQNYFALMNIHTIKLFFNNECFIMMNNMQLSRKWIVEVMGQKGCDYFFAFLNSLNSLKLTDQEMSLLIPFLLTSTG